MNSSNDRPNNMVMLDDSQHDLDHAFEESYPGPNADSMDSLGFSL
jgi:hypothetical protein